jgi:hypothetical protein
LPEPAGSSTTTQSKKSEAVPEVDDGLTAAQLKAALLTLDDMPTGWTQEKVTPDDGKDPKITPAECEAIGDATDGKPDAKAESKFSAGGFGPTLEQSIASWGEETAGMIVKAKNALAKCRKFKSAQDGEALTFQVAGLSFPNIGDRTLAVRMTTQAEGLDATFDVVYVAVGKNSVSLIAGGLQPVDGEKLEGIARKAVQHVKDAGK